MNEIQLTPEELKFLRLKVEAASFNGDNNFYITPLEAESEVVKSLERKGALYLRPPMIEGVLMPLARIIVKRDALHGGNGEVGNERTPMRPMR